MLGYNYGYGSAAMAAAISGILMVVAVIAVVVLTVVACVKFLGKNGDRSSKLGRLFNFDHLFIESIMKFFYILSVVSITVFSVYAVIEGGVVGGFGGFFGSLLVTAVVFFLLQFFCRMSFEMMMAFIRMSSDAHAIRKTVVGDVGEGSTPAQKDGAGASWMDAVAARIPKRPASAPAQAPASEPVPTPAPAAAPAPASKPAADSVSAQAPVASAEVTAVMPTESDAWTCPKCGKAGNTAKFCPKCGCPRP